MAVETINGVAHAKQILRDAGVVMPFEKGYQAYAEKRNKEQSAAAEAQPEVKRGRPKSNPESVEGGAE